MCVGLIISGAGEGEKRWSRGQSAGEDGGTRPKAPISPRSPSRRQSRPGRRSTSGGTCRAASAAAIEAGRSAERSSFRPVRTARLAGEEGAEMELTIVKNATCTFCGCVCDDIELHADGVRITHTKARLRPRGELVQEPHRRAALPRRADRRQARHGR